MVKYEVKHRSNPWLRPCQSLFGKQKNRLPMVLVGTGWDVLVLKNRVNDLELWLKKATRAALKAADDRAAQKAAI